MLWIAFKNLYIYVLNLPNFSLFFIQEDSNSRQDLLLLFVKMSDFEEKSGRIFQKTVWGNWSQSLRDVTVEVELEKVLISIEGPLFEVCPISGHSG